MLPIVRGHIDFLDAAKASLSADAFSTCVDQHSSDMVSAIMNLGQSVVTLADAADSMRAMQAAPFSDTQRAAILGAINHVAAGATAVAASQGKSILKQQEHMFMHRYLTAGDWAALHSPDATHVSKIQRLVARGKSIGLLSMTERTSTSIVAIVVLSGSAMTTESGSHVLYEVLRTVKDEWKKMRVASRSNVTPLCDKYPCDVAVFQAKYPTVFVAGDLPVPSLISEEHLAAFRSSMPCRKTHSSLRDVSFGFQMPGSRSSSSSVNNQMQQFMVPFMQAMMQSGGGRGHGDVSLLHRKRSRPLALMDGTLEADDEHCVAESPRGYRTLSPAGVAS